MAPVTHCTYVNTGVCFACGWDGFCDVMSPLLPVSMSMQPAWQPHRSALNNVVLRS